MNCFARLLLTVVVLLGAVVAAAQAPARQPVYIYLYARVTDHVNLDLTEDRLRRILPMLERFRNEHPEAHVAATILFSGAVSQALAAPSGPTRPPQAIAGGARPPSRPPAGRGSQVSIKDLVLDYARRGVIELGYDGTDEPTYGKRPLPDYSKVKTPEGRWVMRAEAAERFLTEARDLLGNPQAGMTGGLKKMQEVFGEAVCITGVTQEMGGDSEYVQHIGRYNTKAIMFGIPDPDPRRHIPGYRGSALEFGKFMSPIPESSPELYWQDNVLRSSEYSGPTVRLLHGDEGVDAIGGVLGRLDRSKIHIIHMEIGSERMHLRPSPWYPPLKLAYEDPEHPRLPATLLRDADEVDAAYAKEGEVLKWLVQEFFPANPGSRFVSSTDLKQMTPPSADFTISMEGLRATLAEILKAWGNDTAPPPPQYYRVEGHYMSLADMFQVMSDALAEQYMKGKLPQSVRVVKLYGPMEMSGNAGPATGEVTVASLTQMCLGISGHLHNPVPSPVPPPKNIIPSRMVIEGNEINAAQFLRLMAEALLAPSQDTKLKIKMTQMLPAPGEIFPRIRPRTDEGATWTFKPAPLQSGPGR